MPSPNWNMKRWQQGPVTFMQALGFSKKELTFPQLNAQLPAQSAVHQHQGTTSKKSGAIAKRSGPLKKFAMQQLVNNQFSNDWAEFNDVVMAESGWNPHAKNASGAYGIAQALDHGKGSATQGTESNAYGGYGLTDRQAKEANSGNGYWQIVWMINYIKATYGNPAGAWDFHQAHNYY